ncbi:hypothetical protein RND15_51975, partial [Streptomyces sp. DSM 41529]|nr:hypothetical protein [Streptomyces sp. DSM 41529]
GVRVVGHLAHRRRPGNLVADPDLRYVASPPISTARRATPEDAEPLYASLGFARTPDPAMRLRL